MPNQKTMPPINQVAVAMQQNTRCSIYVGCTVHVLTRTVRKLLCEVATSILTQGASDCTAAWTNGLFQVYTQSMLSRSDLPSKISRTLNPTKAPISEAPEPQRDLKISSCQIRRGILGGSNFWMLPRDPCHISPFPPLLRP